MRVYIVGQASREVRLHPLFNADSHRCVCMRVCVCACVCVCVTDAQTTKAEDVKRTHGPSIQTAGEIKCAIYYAPHSTSNTTYQFKQACYYFMNSLSGHKRVESKGQDMVSRFLSQKHKWICEYHHWDPTDIWMSVASCGKGRRTWSSAWERWKRWRQTKLKWVSSGSHSYSLTHRRCRWYFKQARRLSGKNGGKKFHFLGL